VFEVVAAVVALGVLALPAAIAHGAALSTASPKRKSALLNDPSRSPAPESSVEVNLARSAQPPFPITMQDLTLVDPSRRPADRATTETVLARSLRTVVRRPFGPAGPLPLIVFAHGYDTEPETYDPLLDTWASAGYVVAAPELPGSARDLPGSPIRDIAEQARDLSFIVTALLAGPVGPIDSSRVVAAGHSDGASAVATLALNSSFTDTRFTAYVVLSGAIPTQVTEGTWGASAPGQLLVTVGDHDEYGNLAASEAVFDTANLAGAFVRVPGGDHSRIYVGDSVLADTVRSMTVQFLDLALHETESSPSWATFEDNATVDISLRATPRG
jgi:dienelactone hydrolase